MKTITLTLPPAISANLYWRTRVAGKIAMTYVSSEANAYKAKVAAIIRAAGVKQPFPGRVAITLAMYPHRPQDWKLRQRKLGAAWDDSVRCIDLDNASKVVLDSIKGLLMIDDGWPVRDIRLMRMEPDDGPARVVVTVTAIEVEQPQMELCA